MAFDELEQKKDMQYAVMTITEGAQSSKDPYTPQIVTAVRKDDESASDFADRLLNLKAS